MFDMSRIYTRKTFVTTSYILWCHF